MTIVSGDSRGKVTFWNGRQGTQLKVRNDSVVILIMMEVDNGNISMIEGYATFFNHNCSIREKIIFFRACPLID